MEKTRAKLSSPKTADELLDTYFLEARSHLLETAAVLDRIERAPDGAKALSDPRIKQLFDACEILTSVTGNRAEQFLRLFSDPA